MRVCMMVFRCLWNLGCRNAIEHGCPSVHRAGPSWWLYYNFSIPQGISHVALLRIDDAAFAVVLGAIMDINLDYLNAPMSQNGSETPLHLPKSGCHNRANRSYRREADLSCLRLRTHYASNARKRKRGHRGSRNAHIAVSEMQHIVEGRGRPQLLPDIT